MGKKSNKTTKKYSWIFIALGVLLLGGIGLLSGGETDVPNATPSSDIVATTSSPQTEIKEKSNSSRLTSVKLSDIPKYSGNPYVAINNNVPFFKKSELKKSSYEYYSKLDSLGRCGVVYACVGKDLMPTEERGSIGHIRPTGWHTVKYDIVDGKYLYNRCHLIGFQLTGENDNEKNLLTGTRSMNVDGMLPFENMVADYVKETDNHVMYRVTPMFQGKNLLAKGVLLEAKSVEDNGDGILFNVFVYNVQDGVKIDYATGTSQLKGKASTEKKTTEKNGQSSSVNNTSNSKNDVWISETGSKYHSYNSCGTMKPDKAYKMSRDKAEQQGYSACQRCH